MRRNWQGEQALEHMPGVLRADPDQYRRGWADLFGRQSSIHVEIGVGKGDFILTMAAKCPQIDFIGIEMSLTVLHKAAKKYQHNPLPNLRFLPLDAGDLEHYFSPGQVERIYLNFSDPWPKRRHSARRLTAREMLSRYRRVLMPRGQIHFKTDQEAFFAYSLNELIRDGWSVGKISDDLHRSGFEDNVMTEYERRFAELGQPIYRLEAWSPAEPAARDCLAE